MNPIVFLLLVGGVSFLVGSAINLRNVTSAIYKLEYSIKDIKIDTKKSDLFTSYFQMNFNIFNPTKTRVQFQSLVADIIYNGAKITNIRFVKDIDIPSNATKPLVLSFKASNFDALDQIINLFSKGKTSDLIQVKGNLYYNGISLPVNETVKLSEL